MKKLLLAFVLLSFAGICCGQALKEITPVHIGTAFGTGPTRTPPYYKVASREFSAVTLEFYPWTLQPQEGNFDFVDADKDWLWAKANNKTIVIGPLLTMPPDWVTNWWWDRLNSADLETATVNYIQTMIARYPARYYWVVNETIGDPNTWDKIGTRKDKLDFMRIAFRTARQAAPKAKLFYNDHDIEFGGGKQDLVFTTLKKLRAEGVPIDGIGLQCHLNSRLAPDARLKARQLADTIRRFRSIGLQVYITELDVVIPEEYGMQPVWLEAQKTVYEMVVRTARKNGVKLIVVWGFTDKHSWKASEHPCIFTKGYNKKPAYYGVRDGLL